MVPRATPPFPGWAGSGGAGPGGDGGRRRGSDRAAAAAGGSGGAGPGPGLAGGPGAAVPGVPGPLRAAELLGGGAAALPRPPAALHGPDRLDLPRRLQVRVHVGDGAALRPGRPQGAPVPRQVALLAVPVLPGAGLRLRLLPQRPGQLRHAAALQSRRPPRLPHVPHLRRLRLGLLKRLVLVHRFPHEGHGCDGETGLFLRFGRRPALRVPVLRQDAGAAAASLNQHLQGLPPPLPRLPHLLPDPRPLRLRLQHGCERGDRAPQPGVVAAVVPAEPPAPAPRLEVRGRGAAAAGAGAAGAPRFPPHLLGAGRPRALAHRHHPPQRPLLQFPDGRQPLPPEGQLRPLQSGLELPGGAQPFAPPPPSRPVPSDPPAPLATASFPQLPSEVCFSLPTSPLPGVQGGQAPPPPVARGPRAAEPPPGPPRLPVPSRGPSLPWSAAAARWQRLLGPTVPGGGTWVAGGGLAEPCWLRGGFRRGVWGWSGALGLGVPPRGCGPPLPERVVGCE